MWCKIFSSFLPHFYVFPPTFFFTFYLHVRIYCWRFLLEIRVSSKVYLPLFDIIRRSIMGWITYVQEMEEFKNNVPFYFSGLFSISCKIFKFRFVDHKNTHPKALRQTKNQFDRKYKTGNWLWCFSFRRPDRWKIMTIKKEY